MHMARKIANGGWTLEELRRLPDDGNKYELVRGELFVTPAPSPSHERLAVVLSDILGDYARRHGIGRVFRPRAVVRHEGSEVEPDVMVRAWTEGPVSWDRAPTPVQRSARHWGRSQHSRPTPPTTRQASLPRPPCLARADAA